MSAEDARPRGRNHLVCTGSERMRRRFGWKRVGRVVLTLMHCRPVSSRGCCGYSMVSCYVLSSLDDNDLLCS
jgi:hypothetical protein